ncbi:MAG: hypothetical protein LBH69_02265 [Methanomassiliicoccaceae archaeon]|jgi:hypothetical protein|nr:hypothetical protein [Methanomassiliicoccaceae archaeon]
MYASGSKEQIAANVSDAEQSILSWWAEKAGKEEYLTAVYLLQDKAGLSFKEARAWLIPFQYIRKLAAEWKCSEENIHNLRRRGGDKIRKTGDNCGEEVLCRIPAYLYHIL